MNNRQSNYQKVAQAIGYITDNFKIQPDLDQIAKKVGLSPTHFQKLFSEWAGTSPKKFVQYLTLERAKKLLKDNQSVLKTTVKSGLSSPSRLHDLFMTIEGMTPGEYKNGGENLTINYDFAKSPFGGVIIASTSKGLVYLAFTENEGKSFAILKNKFPNAKFNKKLDSIQKNAMNIFNRDWNKLDQIKLHLKGTDFQLKVWGALLKIPMGHLRTYGTIAKSIRLPKANRAVGTAVGANPVAFLIPCHRVIQSTGVFGNYHWGPGRKTAMIGWEAAKLEK